MQEIVLSNFKITLYLKFNRIYFRVYITRNLTSCPKILHGTIHIKFSGTFERLQFLFLHFLFKNYIDNSESWTLNSGMQSYVCAKSLLLSEGRTVVKCICECNQSGRRVVFNPEPVAMSAPQRVEWYFAT